MQFANNVSGFLGQVAPTCPVRIDKSHWAASAIGHAWVFNQQGAIVDLVTGTKGQYGQTPSAATRVVNRYGPGYQSGATGVNDYIITNVSGDDCKQGNLSIILGFSNYTPNGNGYSQPLIREAKTAYSYGSVQPVWQLEADTGALYWDNGINGYATNGNGPGGGQGINAYLTGRNSLNIVQVTDHGTVGTTNMWVNRQQMPRAIGSTSLTFGSGASKADSIQIANNYIPNSSFVHQACFHFVYIFKRALTDAERQSLAANPYQFLVPANESTRIYLASVASIAVQGSGADPIGLFSSTALGTIATAGSGSPTVPLPLSATSGVVYPVGSGQSVISPFAATASGVRVLSGTFGSVAGSVAPFPVAALGVVGSAGDVGTVAATVGRFAAAAQGVYGNVTVSAVAAASLGGFASGGYVVNLGAAVTFFGTDAVTGYGTSATGSVAPPAGVAGNAAAKVPAFVTSSVGILGVTGSAVAAKAVPLRAAAQGIYGTVTVTATAADTLGPFISAGAVVTIDGAVAATVPPFVAATTAFFGSFSVGAVTVPAFRSTAVGGVGTTGSANDAVPAFRSASPGAAVGNRASVATVVPAFVSAATGTTNTSTTAGSSAKAVPAFVATAIGGVGQNAFAVDTITAFTDVGVGSHGVGASASDTTLPAVAVASGAVGVQGSVARTVGFFSPSSTGAQSIGATATPTVGPFVASASAGVGVGGVAADGYGIPTAVASGITNPASGEAGNGNPVIAAFVSAAIGGAGNVASGFDTVGPFTGAAAGIVSSQGVAAVTVPAFRSTASGTASLNGVVAAGSATILAFVGISTGKVGVAGAAVPTGGIWFGNGVGSFTPTSTGGRATKVGTILVAPQTCTAGSLVNAITAISNCTTTYDATITARVANGATPPTVGCTVEIDISIDSIVWRTFAQVVAGTAAGGTYDFSFQIPDSVMYARLGFGGNTAASVTVDGYSQVLAGL